ncbi:MAG: adenylyltransferase/cytidyltransferase family protein [Deltaproteobacteria bacterium]|nr:adenylyltransferase/cytidyltransferase family protein [Deltaproteobacteria bacterium]MBI3077252.1 adenylyltransferase/cytidyltransferase family protein [Deltaproteobacteria bacterium]
MMGTAEGVMARFRWGMIHGRFQPFHQGHLTYLREALSRSDLLLVGITNPDPSTIVVEEADPQRHRPEANPFTFHERLRMVKETLMDERIDLRRVDIIPFPVHHRDLWAYYVPSGTVQFIRVFSAWGREKVQRLQETGLTVEVLDPGAEKEISGDEVRRRMIHGLDWEELVPPAVARMIHAIHGVERLRQIIAQGEHVLP